MTHSHVPAALPTGAPDRPGFRPLDSGDLFTGVFDAETVHAYVIDAYGRIAPEARIKNYLPALTAKIARATLIRAAHH